MSLLLLNRIIKMFLRSGVFADGLSGFCSGLGGGSIPSRFNPIFEHGDACLIALVVVRQFCFELRHPAIDIFVGFVRIIHSFQVSDGSEQSEIGDRQCFTSCVISFFQVLIKVVKTGFQQVGLLWISGRARKQNRMLLSKQKKKNQMIFMYLFFLRIAVSDGDGSIIYGSRYFFPIFFCWKVAFTFNLILMYKVHDIAVDTCSFRPRCWPYKVNWWSRPE